MRVAITYVIGSWLLLQVADVLFEPLGAPPVAMTIFIVVLGLGFPFALILTWVFQVTSDGVVLDSAPDVSSNLTSPDRTDKPNSGKAAIAVLPFVDISPNQDNEHFTDGLTDELLSALTRIPDLRVASRTSCFAFKGSNVDLSDIASTLKVDHIVAGSVRKAGDRLRVSVQLVETDTDTQMWSECYDQELDDIFQIQADISNKVRSALQVTLRSQDEPDATTDSPQAYDYYLRGIGFFVVKGSIDINFAIDMFSRAVKLDPGFAKAWAKLSLCLSDAAIYHGKDEYIAEAQSSAQMAVQLAPDAVESITASGVALLAAGKYTEAIEFLDRAIASDGDNLDAHHYYARAAFHNGDLRTALRMFTRAAECDPADWESVLLVTQLHEKFGDMKAVEASCRDGLARVERFLESHPNNQRAYYLGAMAWQQLGEEQKAYEWADKAIEIAPNDEATNYNVACLYVQSNDFDKAFERLRKSISSRSWIENDPSLDPIRSDPRYEELLSSLD